jgi:hypothetical protein
MPINPNALSGAQPEPSEPEEAAQPAAEEAPKRTRRTKAQMIADAVVPADDEKVELKDAGTGAKIERTWLVALEMVRDGKAEFADKAMKYSMLKHDQQKSASAFEQPAAADSSGTPAENVAKAISIPPEAEVGDEVVRGADVFRVGHDGTLTTGPISVDGEVVQPKRRWQRELGSGVDGPWESTLLSQTPAAKPEANGKGETRELSVGADQTPAQPVKLPEGVEVEQISLRGWRVGTGVLEKIGLPDYSSLQIGPITASREVLDDGRRTQVSIGDRVAVIPTACIEIAQQASDIVEYIARYQRGELVSFLESTGAIKSSVS